MYDLEIVVPADIDKPFIQKRFEDFKKWGFWNIGDTKIRLVLSTYGNRENIETLKTGWPEDISVEIFNTPYSHVAQRIYHYYSTFIQPDTARWYMRIDEDSLNDISGLIENLDKNFDCERDYHICGEINYDILSLESIILKSLGYDWWLTSNDATPHEHEISITSNAAIKKIFVNNNVKKYFKLRKEFADGASDHGLAFCARMEKIYHTQVKFLTREADFTNFSPFGGYRNHIHWISRDKSKEIFDWLENIDNQALQKSQYQGITGLLGKIEQNKTWIKFTYNGILEMIDKNEKAGLWNVNKEGEIILFLNKIYDNNPILSFNPSEDNWTQNGFEFNKISI